MEIRKIACGLLETNCYILHAEGSSDAVLVDPGDNYKKICDTLSAENLTPKAVLLTHGHIDHTRSTESLKAEGVKIYACANEKALLEDADINGSHIFRTRYTTTADVWVNDNETVTLCGMDFLVIATPGHTAGGVCYYCEKEGILFSGDTLFLESVGRTDLATGNADALERSIKERLYTLPGETRVLPGHGGNTNIEHERVHNFCIRA